MVTLPKPYSYVLSLLCVMQKRVYEEGSRRVLEGVENVAVMDCPDVSAVLAVN